MPDFTLHKYQQLLHSLMDQDYESQTLHEYLSTPLSRCIILRHDVDKQPAQALAFAKIESKLGLKGVYYFRS